MQNAWSILAKVSIVFAVIFLLALGLCGISVASNSEQHLATIAIIGMIGGGGLLLCIVASAVLAIVNAVRRPPH